VRAKLKARFVYRKAQVLQVQRNRRRWYLIVGKGSQMHQFDVPERAARALATNRIKHEASRGSWSQTRGVFILNTKVLIQDTQGEFCDTINVNDDVM